MNPKVLIICFTFPPYPGIGGRRWAKFAKYLSRKGCEVRVIAAKKKEEQDSQWLSDIAAYRENVFYIPAGYPLILTQMPRGLWQKIHYRLALIMVRLLIKGNYYDHASAWKKQLIAATHQAILDGYKNIIVTCGPFSTAAFVSELKIIYPELNFILDLRDPWTTNKTSFGFSGLSPARMAIEKRKEKFALQRFDHVMTVSDEMTNYFYRTSDRLDKDRFFTLINGFDAEDFSVVNRTQIPSARMRFVFTGTLYNKSMHMFEELCNVLATMKNEHASVFSVMDFDFFGSVPSTFNDACSGLPNVRFHGELPMYKVYDEIGSSDVAMLFLTDDMNYTFSTKFYEYVSQKIPIAVFSSEGHTGHFVDGQGLGYACFSGHMKTALLLMHDDWTKGRLRFNPDFDTSAFSIEKLSDHILERLI